MSVVPPLDPGAGLLALGPTRRPFPVVADADELVREVSHRARTGKEPLLLSLARHGMARIFATDRVREEVERNLRRVAKAHADAATRVWRDEYRPLIRWVSLPDRLQTGFRADEQALRERMQLVMEKHSADAPTAELALLCAPCFVLTDNRKHLHVAGFGDTGTRDALVAAGDATELELNGIRALSLGELGARGTWALTSKAARLAGDSPIAAALMLAVLAVLAVKAYEGRDQIRAAAGRAGNAATELLEELTSRHADLVGALVPSLVAPLEAPTLQTAVAQPLVRNGAALPAESIGWACRPRLERERVLEGLRDHQAFVFWPGRGWTLGRHVIASRGVVDKTQRRALPVHSAQANY